MTKFAVIKFKDSKKLAVMPLSWFVDEEEDRCFWPKVKPGRIASLVKNNAVPTKRWEMQDICVWGKARSYERACEKLKSKERHYAAKNVQTDTESQATKPPIQRHICGRAAVAGDGGILADSNTLIRIVNMIREIRDLQRYHSTLLLAIMRSSNIHQHPLLTSGAMLDDMTELGDKLNDLSDFLSRCC